MTRTEYIIDDDFLDDETKMSAESQGYLWELIRCKDCIYYRWEIDMCDEPYSTAHNVVHEDDYCSRAERKKNDCGRVDYTERSV